MIIEVIYFTMLCVCNEVTYGNNTNGRIQTRKTIQTKREKRTNPHKEEDIKKLDGEADPE
jgi:hypothetical protein